MEDLKPYEGGNQVTVPVQALVSVEQRRAQSEVESAIIIAKKFPRNTIQSLDRIKTACQRPGLAEAALYSYARGGTDITGPSIRLAEAIAQGWGNLQFGIRELEQRPGESTIEAFAMDMETNVRQVKQFQVKHERHTKSGHYSLSDPRDIYETVANQGARRLRACILGIIPGDVVDEAVQQCADTMKAKFNPTPELIKKWQDAFAKIGVTKEQLEKRIQRRMDAITASQIVSLQKMYHSIRDGMSSPADWFEVAQPLDASIGLKERIVAAKKGKDTPPQTNPVQAEEAPKEMAPLPCPDSPENTYTKAYCDKCAKRLGCPVWG